MAMDPIPAATHFLDWWKPSRPLFDPGMVKSSKGNQGTGLGQSQIYPRPISVRPEKGPGVSAARRVKKYPPKDSTTPSEPSPFSRHE